MRVCVCVCVCVYEHVRVDVCDLVFSLSEQSAGCWEEGICVHMYPVCMRAK